MGQHDHRRSKSKADAKSLKGIIAEHERRRSRLLEALRDPNLPPGVRKSIESEACALESSIERLSVPVLPELPPFDAEPVHRDEWRQARQWPAQRQVSLLYGTLQRLGEARPELIQELRDAFRAAHYEVRSLARAEAAADDGPEDVPCTTSAPPPGISAAR